MPVFSWAVNPGSGTYLSLPPQKPCLVFSCVCVWGVGWGGGALLESGPGGVGAAPQDAFHDPSRLQAPRAPQSSGSSHALSPKFLILHPLTSPKRFGFSFLQSAPQCCWPCPSAVVSVSSLSLWGYSFISYCRCLGLGAGKRKQRVFDLLCLSRSPMYLRSDSLRVQRVVSPPKGRPMDVVPICIFTSTCLENGGEFV